MPRRLCTRLVFALLSFLRAVAVTAWRKRSPPPPNRCLLPLPQITRPRSPPIAFSARGAPPCRKGDNVEQKLRFRRGTAGGNGGMERSVHIGTTKDKNGGLWCKCVFTKILLFCYSCIAKCGCLARVLYFLHRKNRLVAVIVYICARNVI